jgi:hypothetical protein
MGAVIAFPCAPRRERIRPAVSALCPQFRLFCHFRNELARQNNLPYERIDSLRDAWAGVLSKDNGERELRQLRRMIGR